MARKRHKKKAWQKRIRGILLGRKKTFFLLGVPVFSLELKHNPADWSQATANPTPLKDLLACIEAMKIYSHPIGTYRGENSDTK